MEGKGPDELGFALTDHEESHTVCYAVNNEDKHGKTDEEDHNEDIVFSLAEVAALPPPYPPSPFCTLPTLPTRPNCNQQPGSHFQKI